MDPRAHRVAALANAAFYDSKATADYVDGAPHIKHASLRGLYGALVVRVFDAAHAHRDRPRILDLGAGEGSVTLPFLELGADVLAVDISQNQLDELARKTARHAAALEVRRQDVDEALDALDSEGRRFEVVVVNSFLHHVPDYLSMLRKCAAVIADGGQIFSFQDPLRYDSLGRFTWAFTTAAYASWRVLKADVIGGLRRRLRRTRGVWLDTPEDAAEFHAMRGGLDQDRIASLFDELGFGCEMVRYFSTQSRLFQPLGERLRLENTFAVIATKETRGAR